MNALVRFARCLAALAFVGLVAGCAGGAPSEAPARGTHGIGGQGSNGVTVFGEIDVSAERRR